MIFVDKVCSRYLVLIKTFKVLKDVTFIHLNMAPQFTLSTAKKKKKEQ
jgi:hypothetical protein